MMITSKPFRKMTQVLLLSGLTGSLVIKMWQIITGSGGNSMFHRPVLCIIILVTASSFFIGLLLSFPVFMYIKAKEMQSKDGIPMPWWAPLAILTHGGNPKWIVPNTLSIPLLVVMCVLGGFVTYTIVMGLFFGIVIKP